MCAFVIISEKKKNKKNQDIRYMTLFSVNFRNLDLN